MSSKPFYHAVRPGHKHPKPVRLSNAEWQRRTRIQRKAIERSGRQLWFDRRGRPLSVDRPGTVEISSKKDFGTWVSDTLVKGRLLRPQPSQIRVRYTVMLDGHTFTRHYPWSSLSGLEAAGKTSGWPTAEETGDWRMQIKRQLEIEGAFDGPSPTNGEGKPSEPDEALDDESREYIESLGRKIDGDSVESGEPVMVEAWWVA